VVTTVTIVITVTKVIPGTREIRVTAQEGGTPEAVTPVMVIMETAVIQVTMETHIIMEIETTTNNLITLTAGTEAEAEATSAAIIPSREASTGVQIIPLPVLRHLQNRL